MPKDQSPHRFIRDPNYHGCVNQLPRDDKRIPRFLAQRKERGFDDTETWSLDHAILRYTLPRLKRLREVTGGHPGGLTEEKWDAMLGEMVVGIELYLEDGGWGWSDDKAKTRRMRRGMKLFKEWMGALWW